MPVSMPGGFNLATAGKRRELIPHGQDKYSLAFSGNRDRDRPVIINVLSYIGVENGADFVCRLLLG